MGIDYQDLEIELDRCCCGQPEIRILESTFNRPRACFEWTDTELEALAAKVEKFENLLLRGDEHAGERRRLAEEIGIELSRVLLPGEIGRTFERCHDALRQGEGLRLRLSFGREYDRRLGGLPWELLCDPEKHRFIGAEQKTPVVRYLDLGEKTEPLKVIPPLRVLGFVAAPDPEKSERYRFSEIDCESHRAILEEAIGPLSFLEVQCCPRSQFVRQGEQVRATISALHDELIEAEHAGAPYHAVHFVGHGGFDREGEGALFFEDEDGDERLVTGAELARNLTQSVRLVVLASCGTGKIPEVRRSGRHPFAGVASALVARGIPAVVAMQFTVSEAAAKAFAGPFYRAIDRDEPIDAAVTEGRLAIERVGREGELEWATPVLFLRSPDGRVLNLQGSDAPVKTVAVYNVLDLGKERLKHVNVAVDLSSYFARERGAPRISTEWNGAILRDLKAKLPDNPALSHSPIRLEFSAPLSIAFTCGYLLPAKERRAIEVRQRNEIWTFDGVPPRDAPFWLREAAARELVPPDFPLTDGAEDIAVVVEGSRPAIGAVTSYLRSTELSPAPPHIGTLVYACFDRAGAYSIRDGAHAQSLAEDLVARIDAVAQRLSYPTVHFFLAGPVGLAVAIGRLCRNLPRIQLYEYDFEGTRHHSYEPSITLVSPRMGEAP